MSGVVGIVGVLVRTLEIDQILGCAPLPKRRNAMKRNLKKIFFGMLTLEVDQGPSLQFAMQFYWILVRILELDYVLQCDAIRWEQFLR